MEFYAVRRVGFPPHPYKRGSTRFDCFCLTLDFVSHRKHFVAFFSSEMLSMLFLKVLLLISMFNELIADLDTKNCPKGHKVVGDRCEACRLGYYQDVPNYTIFCKPCTLCEETMGSMIEQECSRTTDRRCKCREGFLPRENGDPSICKCNGGFEPREVCSECADGHFSRGTRPCKPWKHCKSGVKFNGTKSSDVVCNDDLNSNVPPPPPRTHTTVVSLLRSTTHRPPEGAQTLKMQTTTVAAAAPPLATLRGKEQPSNTGNHIGIALLMLGIIGLVVLTAVTCKLNIRPCWEKKTAVPKRDSLCGKPVEESGDDSLSSLKLNPGEP